MGLLICLGLLMVSAVLPICRYSLALYSVGSCVQLVLSGLIMSVLYFDHIPWLL